MTKISIIIPVYNAEKEISRCIDSILKQTFKDFEVILVNDGSTDNSLCILQKYKEKDNRIKIINKQNEGVSQARNSGVAVAKGEYIQFVDADDYIDPKMLQEQLNKLESNNADIIISGIYLDIEKDEKVNTSIQTFEETICKGGEKIAKAVLDRLNGTYINSPVNKLYKKSIIIDNNITMDKDIDLGEDLIFNLQYLSFCKVAIFSNACYYHYCMKQGENLTSKYRSNKIQLMKILYDSCLEYINANSIDSDGIKKLNGLFVKWMYSCYIDLNNKNCYLSFKGKLNYIKETRDEYDCILKNTSNQSLIYNILKLSIRIPILALIISKLMFIIKTSFRKIIYS